MTDKTALYTQTCIPNLFRRSFPQLYNRFVHFQHIWVCSSVFFITGLKKHKTAALWKNWKRVGCWMKVNYRSSSQCSSSCRRRCHRGRALERDGQSQVTWRTSLHPFSSRSGSSEPRTPSWPSVTHTHTHTLQVLDFFSISRIDYVTKRRFPPTFRVRRSWMALAKGDGEGSPNQLTIRKNKR